MEKAVLIYPTFNLTIILKKFEFCRNEKSCHFMNYRPICKRVRTPLAIPARCLVGREGLDVMTRNTGSILIICQTKVPSS